MLYKAITITIQTLPNCEFPYNGLVVDMGNKTTIGCNCMIGANVVVVSDFLDDCVIAGVPAKLVKEKYFID